MGTRVKKFRPIHKRPSKTRDFYGPLPSTEIPLKAKKLQKEFNKGGYINEYISLIKLPVLAHKNETLVVCFDTAVSYLKMLV